MYGNMNFGQQPYSMGQEMQSWGGGVAPAMPAGGVVPATPAAAGMTFGTPLNSSRGVGGFMPPTGGALDAGATPAGGRFGNFLSGFGNLAEGLSGLGQLYIGLKSLGIAKDQLAFSKEAYATNLRNTTAAYNTSREDTLRARGVTEGRSQEYTDAKIARDRL